MKQLLMDGEEYFVGVSTNDKHEVISVMRNTTVVADAVVDHAKKEIYCTMNLNGELTAQFPYREYGGDDAELELSRWMIAQ